MPLIESARAQAPSLERIVRFEGDGPESWRSCCAAGEPGVDLAAAEAAVAPDDPIAIVYTSGTTGTPKGAVYDSAAMIGADARCSRPDCRRRRRRASRTCGPACR